MTVDITPIVAADFKLIDGYAEGYYRVAKEKVEGDILIYMKEHHHVEIADFSSLTEQECDNALALIDHPELLLIGTGKQLHMISPLLRKYIKNKGANVEVMDSAAACRTYNALVAEGRKVAVLLAAM